MAYTRLFRCSNEKGKTRRLPKYWIYSLGNFLITIKYKLFLKMTNNSSERRDGVSQRRVQHFVYIGFRISEKN